MEFKIKIIKVFLKGFIIAALAFSCAFSQQSETVVSDVQYCTGGDKPLLMDLFLPAEPVRKPAPAVLWLHGGGWERGDKNGNSGAKLLVGQGFVTASIYYRLSGEAPFPAAIEDCKCAIRFLRANASKYGIDPDRIGVAGASAGGHLALLVGTAGASAGLEGTGGWPDVSSRVRAVAAWYGPTDFMVGEKAFEKGTGRAPAKFLGGTYAERSETYRRASPIAYVDRDTPPILMIHGDKDQIVPYDQSIRMLNACRKVGVDAKLIEVKGADHDFKPATANPILPTIDEIQRTTVEFFRRNLTR
jgi:acetyl esterase/lipase